MENDKPNYYQLLDVDPGASKEDVKRAYRKQALLFHPDKMKPHMKDEASQHFQLISEAYEVLYDGNLGPQPHSHSAFFLLYLFPQVCGSCTYDERHTPRGRTAQTKRN